MKKKNIAFFVCSVLSVITLLSATACDLLPFGSDSGNKKPSGGNQVHVEMPDVEYTVDESLSGTANDSKYLPKNVEMKIGHDLAGKTFYWLGSSVTYGAASYGYSMADYLQATTGCVSKKEAVSGTTIFTDGKSTLTGTKSYTSRLENSKNFDKTEKVDAFICQISTNDAWGDRIKNIGTMTEGVSLDTTKYDKSTTMGGVEFIIAYAISTWHCPVYFYSGSYFGDSGVRSSSDSTGTNYAKLVDEVKKVATKWNDAKAETGVEVGVIDLCNDEDFNKAVSDDYYKWAMSGAIHPKQAGYLQWWTPYFEAYLIYHLVLL